MTNIILVGLGPHAKRIYLKYLKEINNLPKLIVDLKSQEEKIKQYLCENNIENVDLYFVDDEFKNSNSLAPQTEFYLLKYIREHNITHAIISTEPKAHFSYAYFFINNSVSVLMDKPITAPVNVINNWVQCNSISKEYDTLCSLYKIKKIENPNLVFSIQCQRRFQRGYMFIFKMLEDIVRKYKIPISYIDIYHSDGMWNMPDEFVFRENHPYKYGYGKLFHSGYHFIDLLTWILEINRFTNEKCINKCSVYSESYRPSDFFLNFNKQDYKNIFKTEKFNDFDFGNDEFKNYGEIDVHSIINFYNNDNLVTNCSLNLMQSGVSRRAWTELPKDTYKSNGRIRHERVNIVVGPLFNIQVHSYQAYEVKDRVAHGSSDVGDIEHFDILIFRNSDLIGGKPFEKFTIKDLDSSNESNKAGFIGYNEQARRDCLVDFLNNKSNDSNILFHKQSILITENIYKSLVSQGGKMSFGFNINLEEAYKSIATIDDKCFGGENVVYDEPAKVRFGARGIIVDDDNRIAIFHKKNKNEYKLPGGGLEGQESPELAFERECLEEAGVEVQILNCLGTIEENKTKENFKQVSFAFVAKKIRDIGHLNLTQKEKDEGAEILWLNKIDALEKMKKCLGELKSSQYDSVYRTQFMVLRDINILEEYLNNY